MEQSALRWCPHCRQEALHAVVATTPLELAADDPRHCPDDPPLARRKLYCCECSGVWEACEAPTEFLDSLRDLREALDAAQRQIAMLRLLLAKERQAEEAPPSIISLSSAARRMAA